MRAALARPDRRALGERAKRQVCQAPGHPSSTE